METSTLSLMHTGVVPPVCDAEAGEGRRSLLTSARTTSLRNGFSADARSDGHVLDRADALHLTPSQAKHGFSLRKLRSVVAELCSAVRSALDDERGTAEDSLRRAAEILQDIGGAEVTTEEKVRGGLSPWQVRKVTSHIEAHLGRSIRNEDLAALVRLNPSHFGRAFRNSFGEPPHEYVIRRRIERAQGLMLSTDAPLSEIALDCGMADQAHLSRLFRRIVGESPRAWRRARVGEPRECA